MKKTMVKKCRICGAYPMIIGSSGEFFSVGTYGCPQCDGFDFRAADPEQVVKKWNNDGAKTKQEAREDETDIRLSFEEARSELEFLDGEIFDQVYYDCPAHEFDVHAYKAILTAKDAVDKQIPMEHFFSSIRDVDRKGVYFRFTMCPSCRKQIISIKNKYPQFCTSCGQAIGWGDLKNEE